MCYVGQTISTINERWNGHKCDAKRRNTPLYASIRKHIYDIDEIFSREILEDNIPYDKLDEREIFWIKKLNTLYPHGYNLTDGGRANLTQEQKLRMSERVTGQKNPMYGKYGILNPFYGRIHSVESKAKMRQSSIGKKIHSETSKLRIGESVKMRHEIIGHPFLGKHHSKEAKEKISKASKGRTFTDEHKRKMRENHARKRAVVMFDKKGNQLMSFNSMSDAAEWIRNHSNYNKAAAGVISTVCSGKSKTAYGYKWSYLEGVETIERSI